MGNMPVIKDLIVDMDAVHWKKIQRVTPVAARQAARARARVPGAARVDGRRDADDGLHPVRRVRLGLPGDGGRPRLHRPGRARQGLPLRRRPARRASSSSASTTSPRTRRASSTARTASSAWRRARRTSTRWARSCACAAIATADHHIVDRNNGERHEAAFTALVKDNGLLWEAELLPRSYGGNSWFGKFAPAAAKELLSSLPAILKALLRGKVTPMGALKPHRIPARRPEGACSRSTTRSRATTVTRHPLRAEPLRHGERRGRRARRCGRERSAIGIRLGRGRGRERRRRERRCRTGAASDGGEGGEGAAASEGSNT